MARGDVEEYAPRDVRPEDNGQLGPDRSGGVPPFPTALRRPLRAKAGGHISQIRYARRDIITPDMEYAPDRVNPGRPPTHGNTRHRPNWGTEHPTPDTHTVGNACR